MAVMTRTAAEQRRLRICTDCLAVYDVELNPENSVRNDGVGDNHNDGSLVIFTNFSWSGYISMEIPEIKVKLKKNNSQLNWNKNLNTKGKPGKRIDINYLTRKEIERHLPG